MKATVAICFVAGISMGSWKPEIFDTKTAEDQPQAAAKHEPERSKFPDASGMQAVRQTADGVAISREQLDALVALRVPPALSSGDFVTREGVGTTACFENLASWCQLSALEKQRLAEILREAADARVTFVKANVKVESKEPGHWSFDYPGDAGKPKADLKIRIEDAFAPGKADAIQLGADLDNFFGLGLVAPEFKNGRVEIHAFRSSDSMNSDPAGDMLIVKVSTFGELTEIHYQLSQQDFYEMIGPFHELIRWDDLVAAATEAARE